jgi:hypothetical protein
MKSVTLELSLDEANLVLEALGALPFVRVYALIGKIQQQAQRQVGEGDVPAAGAVADEAPS